MTIMMPSSCLSSVPAEVDSTPDLATPAASTGLMESHYPLMCRGAAAGDLAAVLRTVVAHDQGLLVELIRA